MCRYAVKTYKIHFACFDCRKAFKKAPVEDLAIQNGDWEDYKNAFWNYSSGKSKTFRSENPARVEYLLKKYKNREEKCPECGKLMADLGLDFKAPKKDKVKEWEIIKGLFRSGKTFHSCGCDGIGCIPKNKDEYAAYLLSMRAYYQARLTNRDALGAKDLLSDYLQRFGELITMIDRELKILETNYTAHRHI